MLMTSQGSRGLVVVTPEMKRLGRKERALQLKRNGFQFISTRRFSPSVSPLSLGVWTLWTGGNCSS